jgi:hypothetical protein
MANALKNGLVAHYPCQSNAVNMVDGVAGTINGTPTWRKNSMGKVVLDDTTASVAHASHAINTVTYWKDGKFYAVLNGVPYMIDEALSSSFGVDVDAIGAAIQYGIPDSPNALWMPAQDTSSLKDISPNKNNATVSNCAVGSGRALTFNGSSTKGTVADSASLDIAWDAQCFWPTGLAAVAGFVPQGLATDGTNWYTCGARTGGFYVGKVSHASPNTVVAANTTPFAHDANLTHLGECHYYEYDGTAYLYASADKVVGTTASRQQICRYNPTTLAYVDSIDISAAFVDGYAGWAIDGVVVGSDDTIYVHVANATLPYLTNKIFKFDHAGTKTGEIALSTSIAINGLEISADDTLLYTTADNSSTGYTFRISDGQEVTPWTTELGLSGETHAQGLALDGGYMYNMRRIPANHIRKYTMSSFQNGFTCVVWFKPASVSVNQSFVRRYDFPNNLRQYDFVVLSANKLQMDIGRPDGTAAEYFITTIQLTINKWQLAVATYDGIQLKIWKRNINDGSWTSRIKTATTMIGMTSRPQAVLIGDDVTHVTPLNGQLGLMGLWGRTLSATEIETLFQSTKGYYS